MVLRLIAVIRCILSRLSSLVLRGVKKCPLGGSLCCPLTNVTSFTYEGEVFQEMTGVIVRNMNDPNLHIDMAHANQVMQLRQQQQMIEQQSMDNLMRSMQTNSLINTLQGIESRLPPPYYGY